MNKCFCLVFAFCLIAHSVANGSVIYEFNSSSGDAATLTDANAGEDTAYGFNSFVANGSNLEFLTVGAVTDLGNPFTFDVVISPAGNSTGVTTAANNGSIVQTSSTQFGTGDGIGIAVSNISDPNIVLDGFTNFGTDFSGGGEGFTIEGVTYLRNTATNGDNDPRRGIVLPGGTLGNGANQPVGAVPGLLAQSSVQVDFNGASVGLRGFAIQFTDNTAVPEPSAALLFGLGSLGLLGRRRR